MKTFNNVSNPIGTKFKYLDIYGNMQSRYDKVISFEAGEKVTLLDEAFIADFGGFAHEDQERLIDALDVYVVPFTTDDDCAEKTMDTLVSISDTLTPVVLLANMVEPSDTEKVKEIYESLSGILKYDFYPSYIKKYRSFKTATNKKQSVVKYAMQYTENKNKGFREKQLSPAGEELFRFMLEIKKIVEETK